MHLTCTINVCTYRLIKVYDQNSETSQVNYPIRYPLPSSPLTHNQNKRPKGYSQFQYHRSSGVLLIDYGRNRCCQTPLKPFWLMYGRPKCFINDLEWVMKFTAMFYVFVVEIVLGD